MMTGLKKTDKHSFNGFLEWLKSQDRYDLDWSLFIDLIRFHLLPILSRGTREEKGRNYIDSDINFQEKFDFCIKRLSLSAAQKIVSVIQKRKCYYYRNAGNKSLYVSPFDRFFLSYKDSFQNSKFTFFTDRVTCLPGLISVPIPESAYGETKIKNTYLRLVELLCNFGITLDMDGFSILKKNTIIALRCIKRAREFFDTYPIDGLVLDGDSWLPVSAFAMIAKERNIPVLCIQHGLDCEHWCLDEAFSPYYCVWGPTRKARYVESSDYQPKEIFVTGNPLFDRFSIPKSVSEGGLSWLFLTRPHAPEKCYEPSRYPEEGVAVLRWILKAMRQTPGVSLVIRLHPKDKLDGYLELIAEMGGFRNIMLSKPSISLYENIQNADAVFTEDSTSGAEAMLFGKPLVHVSACKAGPVLPLVDYGAALPGTNEAAVEDSVKRLAKGLSIDERQAMHAGQVAFLRDYFGNLDGRAAQRVGSAIRSVFE